MSSGECMIDWVSAVVPWYTEKPIEGLSLRQWDPSTGEVFFDKPGYKNVEGSGSARSSVRSHPMKPGFAEVSGNPGKWLQGHNLVGSDDLIGLVFHWVVGLSRAIGVPIPKDDLEAIAQGRYRLTRVDINAMWEVGPYGQRSDVLAWLRAVGSGSRKAGAVGRLGRGVLLGDTCYWGKTGEKSNGASRYHILKAYCKAQEIELKGRFPSLPQEIEQAGIEWLQNKLRLELTFGSKGLGQAGLIEARNWFKRDVFVMLMKQVEQIEVSGSQIDPSKSALLANMPLSVRMVYESWLAGVDVRANMRKATFYKYRKMLLPLGIDLAIRQGPDRSNVVPLIRVLEAKPATIPDFFYKAGAVFVPTHQPRLRVVK